MFLLAFLFVGFPFWNVYIRLGLFLDTIFYPGYHDQHQPDPIFIIGNYRSGSTFFHRLLLKDEQFTCLKAWEIYFAPAITHRKLIRLILRISKGLGSPVQRAVAAFDRLLNNIYSMHKTGLYTYEQDSQLFYHTWSSFNLFAIFPFPDQVRKYIYYDQLVPEQERTAHFAYYRGVLQRHLYLSPSKRYLSKNPDFTPAVQTLLDSFPGAKFINLVRSPESMIPSAINLWSSNWKAYGTPREKYPLTEVIKEYARHWYSYPHQQLSDLPRDRYSVVYFDDLVENPEQVVSSIYDQFGLDLGADFRAVLHEETMKSRDYNGQNHYSLEEMGQDEADLKLEFEAALQDYSPTREPLAPVLEIS